MLRHRYGCLMAKFTDAELEMIELSKFNPAKPLVTMENIKLRLDAGYVVYAWQFKAFIDAYEKLRVHLEKLDNHRKYLGAWALLHSKAIERYEQDKIEQRQRYLANLRSTAYLADTDVSELDDE